jgi:hypothetical protein
VREITYHVNKRVPKLDITLYLKKKLVHFYKNYTQYIGFSVRKGGKHYVKNTSIIQHMPFSVPIKAYGLTVILFSSMIIFIFINDYSY